MTDPNGTSRRDFIAELGAGAGVLALAACAPTAQPGAAPSPKTAQAAATKWDDRWTTRLGKYRTVFDVSESEQFPGAAQIAPIMDNYHEALGVSDSALGFVLVVRHQAVPILVDDELWAKYNLGADLKSRDRTTNAPYQRNPSRAMIEQLQKRGVIVLGCHSALSGYGAQIAGKAKADRAAVTEEVLSHVLPGVILQPTGVYAIARAQNVGCGYLR